MSILEEIGISAPKTIGGIAFQAIIEEQHYDELVLTEHPVEKGAAISDHAYKKPREVVIKCGWSNSSGAGLVSALTSLASGSLTGSDYVTGIYSQLLALQESREPFDLTTSSRLYQNMLLTSMSLTRDAKTSTAIMLTLVCREVLIVTTAATKLPPKEGQAAPASTGQSTLMGIKNLVPATPSAGGAVSYANWK